MTYFSDLSWYEYRPSDAPGAKNVGWLEKGKPFESAPPREADLRALWEFCKVAVHATRGGHHCDQCDEPATTFERFGSKLFLGSAEIRVVSASGQSYAAPNMIFHYVEAHHYRPPEEFLVALRDGPRPPSEEYFDKLRTRGLKWESMVRS